MAVAQKTLERPAALKWVKAYSYLTLGAVLYGLAWAHLPYLVGQPWSTCGQGGAASGCVLALHLFEVPPVLFHAYVAWYGLRRFSPAVVRPYGALLTFAAAFNFVCFAFEVNVLLAGLQRQAPGWEVFGLTSIALVFGGGAGLAVYVNQLLTSACSDRKN